MTKFTDLTKEQQGHFLKLISIYGNIPQGTTHLDLYDQGDSSFTKICGDSVYYWEGEWVDLFDNLEYYYPLPSPPYYVPEYDPFKESTNSPLDVQEGGNHYKKCKIQPIEYIHANNIGYLEGNVIKYVTRHQDKNGVEDIKKAMHYLELILEMQYGDN